MAAADIVRGVTSGSSGSGTSTNSQVVVTAPAGLQSGDKLAVIMSFRTAVPAASAPAGWTLANAGSTADASGEGYIYTAEYGTDVTGSSWTFNSADTATANKLAWACVALKGTSAGAKQVSLFGVKSTTATTNPTGTLTTTAPAHIIALSGDRQSSGSTWTWPAGWVEQADVAGTGTNGASSTIAVYDTTPAAAGNYSVTPTALNSGSNAWWGLIAYSVASGGNPSTIAVDLSGTGTLTASVQGPSTLPGPIDGIEPEGHTHVPVYCDANGNLYRVTEEYGIPVEPHNTARMMKSADGGKTWAEVDQANRPPAADLEGVWLLQVGTELWWSHTNGGFVSFSIFNTSDAATNPDKWAVRDERPVTGLSAGSQQFSSLARTSDGRAWVFYSDTLSGTNKQLAYIRRTGTNTWTAPTKIGTTSDSLTGPMSVVGKNDVTHIVYHDYANKQLLWRTLTAAGVLSAATRIDTSGTNTATRNYNAATAPVYYDAAGAEVITVAFASASGIRTVTITNGTPAAEQVITSSAPKISPPNGIDGNTGNDGPALHLAVDGTTVHAIWVDDTTGDLMHSSRPHGGSWATPDVLWDAPGTDYVAWTYCNVYTRGGAKKLGYTYDHAPHADNDSNIWFNELALAAGPVTVDVNLSGTGALTATLSAPTTSKSAALSGTGALTATATAPTTSASAALSGTGGLAATLSAPTTTKTAALSGTGDLTASVVSSGPVIPVSLSGTGTLTATTSGLTTSSPAALSGTGALTAPLSAPTTTIPAALTGTGALAATAAASATRAAALSGTGVLSAAVAAVNTTIPAALGGAGALTASATAVGGPPDTPTLLARSNKITPTGIFTDKWIEASPTADRTFDFRGAEFRGFFLADPVLGYKQWDTANGGTAATAHEKNNTPFDIAGSTPATRAAIIGGKVLGDQARTYTWNSHKHGTPAQDDLDAGISPTTVWNTWASKNTDGDPRIRVAEGSWAIVDGLRVDNSHDGFGIYSATNSLTDTGKVYLRNCWINFCHDDAIENDRGYLTLDVDDCLFEDIHGFISVSGASTPATPDPTKVQTVRNSIISFKPKPGPYQQKTSVLGHGGVYKDQSNSPPLVMSDTIIAVEKFANASSQANLPTAAGCSYTNVTIVWLGQGAYPGNVPAGCTLTTDRSVLDNAVAAWKARHGVTDFDTVDMTKMIAPLATAPTAINVNLSGTGALTATLSAPTTSKTVAVSGTGALAATVAARSTTIPVELSGFGTPSVTTTALKTTTPVELSGGGLVTATTTSSAMALAAALAAAGELTATIIGFGPPTISYAPVTADLVDDGTSSADVVPDEATADLVLEVLTADLITGDTTAELVSDGVSTADIIDTGEATAILDSDGVSTAELLTV